MLKRGRAELVLCFLLGIAVFAFYEAIASFQASNCSYQEHEKRDTEPGHPNASAQEQRKDRSEQKNNAAVSEPFACTFFGAPTALRVFMNHNEGFFRWWIYFLVGVRNRLACSGHHQTVAWCGRHCATPTAGICHFGIRQCRAAGHYEGVSL